MKISKYKNKAAFCMKLKRKYSVAWRLCTIQYSDVLMCQIILLWELESFIEIVTANLKNHLKIKIYYVVIL